MENSTLVASSIGLLHWYHGCYQRVRNEVSDCINLTNDGWARAVWRSHVCRLLDTHVSSYQGCEYKRKYSIYEDVLLLEIAW